VPAGAPVCSRLVGVGLTGCVRFFWLGQHFFHPGRQPLQRALVQIDARFKRIGCGASFLAVGLERGVQQVNVLQTVPDRHFRRKLAIGVVGEDLFVVVGGHEVVSLLEIKMYPMGYK